MISLGKKRGIVETLLWAFAGCVLLLPTASLIATSLVKTYGLPLSGETLTFENFAEVLWRQSVTLRAFANSTSIAAVAAIIIATLALLLGYFLSHRAAGHRRLGIVAASQAEIAFAIPGLVMSIAFILTLIKPLPVLNVSLYGTLWIILIAYISVFLAVGLKPVAAAFLQMDRSLEDAAKVSGASFLTRMRRIFTPLAAPSAASGATLVFLTAYNESDSVSSFVVHRKRDHWQPRSSTTKTAATTTLAAAMSVVVVLATIVVMIGMNGLARHVPPGTVPWKD